MFVYYLVIYIHNNNEEFAKIKKDNEILHEQLVWDEVLRKKVDEMKIEWDGIGGFIEATKDDIDRGDLEGIQDKLEKMPKEYLETIFAERILEHGLKIYHWIDNEYGYPVMFPEKSYISSEYFHLRKFEGKVVYHGAIDIVNTMDHRILSSAGGVVANVGYNNTLGNYIVIKHNINGTSSITEYAHASNIYVKKGERVARGQVIGLIGLSGNTSGYHLHFVLKKWNKKLKKYMPINMVATTTWGLRIK